MNIRFYRICTMAVVFLFAVLFSGILASEPGNGAQDWPKYRGPAGDGISPETGLLQSWPADGPAELWRIPVGVGYSPLAIADGKVVTMDSDEDSEFLFCVEAATGAQVWRTRIGPLYKSSYGDGPRSCPTIDGDMVYALGGTGMLSAFNLASGAQIWSIDVVAEFEVEKPDYWFGYGSSPFIAGEMLLLNVGGKDGKSIAALNKQTGEAIWTAHDDYPAYSTPTTVEVAGQRQFVFVTAKNVVAVSPAGDLLWQYPWGGNVIKVAKPIFLPPDKIFVSASYGIGAVLLRIKPQFGGFAVEEVWKDNVMSNHFNTSILLGDHLYGFDNGTLKCIEALTGAERWGKRRLGKGSLIYADGHFIVLNDRGKLVLIEATPEGYIEKGSVQVLSGRSWTPPSLANGRVFVRNQKEMVCLEVAKNGNSSCNSAM